MPTCPIPPNPAAVAKGVAVRTGEICGACRRPLEPGQGRELYHGDRRTRERLCQVCSAAWGAQRAKALTRETR